MTDAEIVSTYTTGVGIRTLVTESGLSYGAVWKRLSLAGVLRPRGRHSPMTYAAKRMGEREKELFDGSRVID